METCKVVRSNVPVQTIRVSTTKPHQLSAVCLIVFKHIPGTENEADIFTKNTDAATLHKHTEKMCGKDNLYEILNKQASLGREGARSIT